MGCNESSFLGEDPEIMQALQGSHVNKGASDGGFRIPSADLAAIRKCFRAVDADGSGTIDDEEWQMLVVAMEEFYGFKPQDEDLIELSYHMDSKPGAKQISFIEFSKGMRKWMEQRPAFVMLRPQQRKDLFNAFQTYSEDGEGDRITKKGMETFINETHVFTGVVPDEEKDGLLDQMEIKDDCYMNWQQVRSVANVTVLQCVSISFCVLKPKPVCPEQFLNTVAFFMLSEEQIDSMLAPTQFWQVPKTDEAGLKACFEALDIDGSETIDEEEWISQAASLYDFFGYEPSEQDAKDLFFLMDTDGNGEVDFEEYKYAIQSWSSSKPAYIMLTDTQKQALRTAWTKYKNKESRMEFPVLQKFIKSSALFEHLPADEREDLASSLMQDGEEITWGDFLNGIAMALLSKEQRDALLKKDDDDDDSSVEGDGKMDKLD